jgi:sortase A
MTAQPPTGREKRRPRARGRVSVIGIIGEVLITAGVLVFLFLGWQLWLNDLVVGAVQDKAGVALSHSLSAATPVHQAPTPTDSPPKDYGQPIVAKAPGNAQKFAVMYIPRFGATYSRPVSEGVGTADVLDKNGIGHYPGTQMPGEVGNFAVAAHRTTHGAPFGPLATLQVGDKIYLQTADGYYTYDFRGLEYVRPTGVGVLDAVPQAPGVAATDRVMTMTSCNPKFSASERIIAYAVFESWQPTSAGPPAAITAIVNGSN